MLLVNINENYFPQPEEGQEKETEKRNHNFDAVVIHGFGVVKKITKGGDVRYEPDIDGKMRIVGLTELVLEMVEEGKEIPQIIISGGKTSKDKNAPSEARAMQNYLVRLLKLEVRWINNKLEKELSDEEKDALERQRVVLQGLIDGSADKPVIREEESIDTTTNLRHVLNQIEEKKWTNVLYFTNEYHSERVHKLVELFNGLDEHSSGDEDIVAEDMLLRRSSEFGDSKYNRFVDRFNSSPGMVKRKFLEKANLALLNVDPEGKVAKKLAQFFRQRHNL